MTEKLYEVDSYVQNFTAQVVSCTPVPGGFAVVLDRTAFFPEGGSQPCDTGRLGVNGCIISGIVLGSLYGLMPLYLNHSYSPGDTANNLSETSS